MTDKQFWENKWSRGETGWDLGEVSPPIKAYVDQIKDKSLKILIPGAGNSYEARYLVENGFSNITVIDISQHLIEKLEVELQNTNVNLLCKDFFELQGAFDLIIEQTFFCAIDPKLRSQYVNKMVELLSPNGRLVGVLFDFSFEGGPPYGGTKSEYIERFSPKFNIEKIDACYNSIAPRAGRELWIELRKSKAF